MKKLNVKLVVLFLCLPFILFSQDYSIVKGTEGMASTAHPLASQTAVEILKKGGNAVDAAVAAAFVIGVVEPDGSGIGGGGGMLIYMAKTQQSFYINYYAKSPQSINRRYDSETERHSGKSICIPGTVAGLTLALEKFGSLPLSTVLEPAIRYAKDGFPIDGTLASLILDNTETLTIDQETANVYLDEGFPKMEGDLLIQTKLAETLEAISKNGHDGFYKGAVAQAIVDGVKERGGTLEMKDLENYKAELGYPLKGSYRGYEILSAGVPQAGSSIIQGLNILENVDLRRLGHYTQSSKTLHYIAETFRKVYTDRYYFVGDPNYFDVPLNGLMSKEYGTKRFNDINPYYPDPKSYRDTEMGTPGKYNNVQYSEKKAEKIVTFGDEDNDASFDDYDEFDSWGESNEDQGNYIDSVYQAKSKKKKEKRKKRKKEDMPVLDVEHDGSTTHLCVIDKDGNAVSLTQTLGTFFGSAQTVAGVLLNCGMSNFSTSDNPNILKKNKQPRSSISPTIVLRNDKPYLLVGSPGGSRIIATVLQVLVNVLDFDMDVEEANRAPRFYTQKWEDYLHLESGISEDVIKELKKMGHSLRIYSGRDLFFGGVQMIKIDPVNGEYSGSADIRRGGIVVGY